MLTYRVLAMPPRPSAEAIAELKTFPVPMISDGLGRLRGAVGLRPYHRSGRLAGPAFTVKTRPGDNLMVLYAISLAMPGDVVVVDGGGELNNALAGEIMLLWAKSRGLGGFVLDGAVRDLAAYASDDFPCFARGTSHRGPYKDGPGEINIPVSIGGLVVEPGDVIVGDEDGIVAVPVPLIDEAVAFCREKAEAELSDKGKIAAGTYFPDWLRTLLVERDLA